MEERSYSYGKHCAFMGANEPSCSRAKTACRAKDYGYGFIQENIYVDGFIRRTVILAWDVKVCSYEEALEMFKDDQTIAMYIRSHYQSRHSVVYLIAPLPDGGVDLFPFDMVDSFKKVRYEDLLNPAYRP